MCTEKKSKKMKTSEKKISKGYRLKPGTHKLVNKIQAALRTDVDTVISTACKFFYKEIKNNSYKIKVF